MCHMLGAVTAWMSIYKKTINGRNTGGAASLPRTTVTVEKFKKKQPST